jgi:hypothetical protein
VGATRPAKGREACDLGEWALCVQRFDEAAALDPSIEEKPWVQTYRAAAKAALTPPAPQPVPPVEDSNGKKGPAPNDSKGPGAAPRGTRTPTP